MSGWTRLNARGAGCGLSGARERAATKVRSMTDRKKTGSGRGARASSRGRRRAQAAASTPPSQKIQQNLEEAEADAVKAAMEKREAEGETESETKGGADEPASSSEAEAVDADHAKRIAKESRGEAEDAEVLSEESPAPEEAEAEEETAGPKPGTQAPPKPEPLFKTRTARPIGAETKPTEFPFTVAVASAVAGGVIGALVILIGASQAGLFGGDTTALEQRLAAVESRGAGASQTSVEALEARLAELRSDLDAAAAPGSDPGAAEERRVLQMAQDQLGDANRSLTERLGALETAMADRQASEAETLETLRAEIAALGAGSSGEAGAGGPVQDPRVAGLEQRLSALESDVAAQAETLAADAQDAAPQTDVLAEIGAEIEPLKQQIATLQHQIEGGAEDAREIATALGALQDRVAALESEAKAFAQGEAAIGVAFGVLSQAVAGSAPYADSLATVERIAEVEAPAALKDHAETGLPSVGSLAARFDGASRDALTTLAQAEADEEGDVADAIAKRLSSFVVIRRTEESEGDDPAAVLSRAEARIDEGDVAAALREIDKLPQAARSGMGDWLRDAHVRADAEAALDDLRRELLPAQ